MTIKEAINFLLSIENKKKQKIFTEKTKCVGCAQLGSKEAIIKYGTAKQLNEEKFDKLPQCLIIPAKLHFVEEEDLEIYNCL
ncbi:hypothetical protein HY643_04010 [Candidatus Woesearchaeota archaeon]|nr:hypothetical protein [Candidatus Woesearchaeota archaeon]